MMLDESKLNRFDLLAMHYFLLVNMDEFFDLFLTSFPVRFGNYRVPSFEALMNQSGLRHFMLKSKGIIPFNLFETHPNQIVIGH